LTSGTFTAPGTFNETIEYVVVAGGGSGGALFGGGGAGGYITGTTPISGPSATTIQVGAGAASPIASPDTAFPGSGGTPSYFGTPLTSQGGGFGGGGPGPSPNGGPGGSGGGGSDWAISGGTGGTGNRVTGSPTPAPAQGNNGGNGAASNAGGGGGGGAGGAGGNGTSSVGGLGGIGIQLPTTFRNPVSTVGAPGPSGTYWVAGGGGGGTFTGTYPTATGSVGGGPGGPFAGAGNGGLTPDNSGTSALENTGSGGGGGSRNVGSVRGGNGGSGIVLIAYPS